MNEIVTLNGESDAILTIRIDTEKPIELRDFVDSLQAFELQFRRDYERSHPERDESETKLIVKTVRTGSIIVDLIAVLAPIISDMERLKAIIDYVDIVKSKIEHWRVPGAVIPRRQSRSYMVFSVP